MEPLLFKAVLRDNDDGYPGAEKNGNDEKKVYYSVITAKNRCL